MILPRNRLLFWFAVVALPFSVLAGALPETVWLALAALGLLGAVVVADAIASRHLLAGVAVEAPEITRLQLGEEGRIALRILVPTTSLRSLRVAVPLPTEFAAACDEMELALPGGTGWSGFPWTARPGRRGAFALESAAVETTSPLGFWNVRSTLPLRGELRVYPALRKDRASLGLLLRGANGLHAQRQVGKGREFEKLRDYVPGDGLEDIHWKATARRGRPITKVFQVERTQEVYVAIDSSRLSDREDAIERHLATALLIATAAEHQGDLFGLLAFSDRVETFVRARNGASHFHACRDAIYSLQPRAVNPDFDEVNTFIRLRLRRRALVIFLTALDDPVLSEDFLRRIDLIARQHLVLVGMIRPSGLAPLFQEGVLHADAIYERLAGHLRWQNLSELESRLLHRGVRFFLTDDAHMATRMVSEYLNVKSRQLL